jgi:hypothetical protein
VPIWSGPEAFDPAAQMFFLPILGLLTKFLINIGDDTYLMFALDSIQFILMHSMINAKEDYLPFLF